MQIFIITLALCFFYAGVKNVYFELKEIGKNQFDEEKNQD